MTKETLNIAALKPTDNHRLIDLVRDAGHDVSGWRTPSDPSYCYEWCFEQEGMFVINIWFENIKEECGEQTMALNMRNVELEEKGVRAVRARRFDEAVRKAFETGSHLRAIILDRSTANNRVGRRWLDSAPWTVRSYYHATGDFELTRGIKSCVRILSPDPELSSYPEGALRTSVVKHRERERRLRRAKLEEHKRRNHGRIICEVPRCGFDFYRQYGILGQDYAHVHHMSPLGSAPEEGTATSLDELAIVCANCHAMIHRRGECRKLSDLIPPQGTR